MSNLNNDELFHQIATMTELTREQKRIRIAEACKFHLEVHDGITWIRKPNGRRCASTSRASLRDALCDNKWCVPDYFGSLDAMAEARKSLAPEQQLIYAKHLFNLTCQYLTNHQAIYCNWHLCDASAAQHAEAFGRTLKLW